MKKICILALSIAVCLGATAQETKETKELMKAEETLFKDAKEYPAFKTALGQAQEGYFNNPLVSSMAQTYYIPGKVAFKLYDDYYLKKQLGQEASGVDMASSLMDGYNLYMKALPLDKTVDAKGKEKTKYTKDIINTISGHFADFSTCGSLAWDAQNYALAYDCWGTYVKVAQNPIFKVKLPNDSALGQNAYFAGLAAWQADKLQDALDMFDIAMNNNFSNADVYEYGLRVAAQMKNSEATAKFAEAGLQRFGTTRPIFLLYTLNGYIENKDYDKAMAMIDTAIAKEPNNDVYYFSKGVIEDARGDFDASIAAFKKATEINPKNAGAFNNLGKVLCEKIDKLDNEYPSQDGAAYTKFRQETLFPMMREAASYFEKAYELDSDNMAEAISVLKRLYYNLGDEANMKRVEQMN